MCFRAVVLVDFVLPTNKKPDVKTNSIITAMVYFFMLLL